MVRAGENLAMGETKTCSRCGKAKALADFYEQKGGAQGRAADGARSAIAPHSGRPGQRIRRCRRVDGRLSSGGATKGWGSDLPSRVPEFVGGCALDKRVTLGVEGGERWHSCS